MTITCHKADLYTPSYASFLAPCLYLRKRSQPWHSIISLYGSYINTRRLARWPIYESLTLHVVIIDSTGSTGRVLATFEIDPFCIQAANYKEPYSTLFNTVQKHYNLWLATFINDPYLYLHSFHITPVQKHAYSTICLKCGTQLHSSSVNKQSSESVIQDFLETFLLLLCWYPGHLKVKVTVTTYFVYDLGTNMSLGYNAMTNNLWNDID